MKEKKDFWVECNVCKHRLKNWVGSTPCCGSIAWVVEINKRKMKTMTITGIMADFLDSIRAYEHESGEAVASDERESSEFVDMYFNNGGKLKIEERKPLFITEDGVEIFRDDKCFAVDVNTLRKCPREAYEGNYTNFKYFFHEDKADEYIAWNKKVFSVNDLLLADVGIRTQTLDKLQQLVIERSGIGK